MLELNNTGHVKVKSMYENSELRQSHMNCLKQPLAIKHTVTNQLEVSHVLSR